MTLSTFFLLASYVIRDIARSRMLFALIVSGLSVASAAILLTVGVLNGFQTMLGDSERGWLSDIVITPTGDDRTIAENSRLEAELAAMEGVEAFSLRSQGGQILVRYEEEKTSPFLTIGIDTASTEQATLLSSRVIEGSFFESGIEYSNEVVLGKIIADSLVGSTDDGRSVGAGDDLYVLGPHGESKRFRVRGIIDAKTFFPNWSLFMTKQEYEKLDPAGRNAQMVVKIKPGVERAVVIRSLQDRFPKANIRTWEEESKYVQDIMLAVSFITQSIHYLLVLTIFTIVSVVIYINISQKKRQIGILKSMGAENRFILSAYLLESCTYAGVAFVIGCLIFFALYSVSSQHPLPMLIGDFRIVFSLDILISAWITVFVATLGGGFIPAYMASRTHIIDVMRGTV